MSTLESKQAELKRRLEQKFGRVPVSGGARVVKPGDGGKTIAPKTEHLSRKERKRRAQQAMQDRAKNKGKTAQAKKSGSAEPTISGALQAKFSRFMFWVEHRPPELLSNIREAVKGLDLMAWRNTAKQVELLEARKARCWRRATAREYEKQIEEHRQQIEQLQLKIVRSVER